MVLWWLSAVADCNSHQNRPHSLTPRALSSNWEEKKENRPKEGGSRATCRKKTKNQSSEFPVFRRSSEPELSLSLELLLLQLPAHSRLAGELEHTKTTKLTACGGCLQVIPAVAASPSTPTTPVAPSSSLRDTLPHLRTEYARRLDEKQ